jgi:hypothetical protein
LAEPVFLKGQYAAELIAVFSQLADSPAGPAPKLWGDVEKGLGSRFFGGFCDVEIEGGGIAEDNQIDLIALQETSCVFYELVKEANVAEGVVEHSGACDGGFEELAAGGGHFWAAYADEVNVITALF